MRPPAFFGPTLAASLLSYTSLWTLLILLDPDSQALFLSGLASFVGAVLSALVFILSLAFPTNLVFYLLLRGLRRGLLSAKRRALPKRGIRGGR